MTCAGCRPYRGAYRPFNVGRGRRNPCRHRTPEQVRASVNWEAFYTDALGELRGHGPWRSARCPFHDDRHPSFRVNVETGCYWCPVCNVRGDGFGFLMARDGLTFREAVQRLEGFAS